jgi:hypothetical protein
LIRELKEICNLIVGEWYSEDSSHKIIFHFNDIPLRESKLIISSNGKENIFEYGIAVLPHTDRQNNYQFYIDIGRINKKYYLIKVITHEILVLVTLINFVEQDEIINYKRIKNISFADEIIKTLS